MPSFEKRASNLREFDPWSSIAHVDEVQRPVVACITDVPDGFIIPPHRHKKGQVIFSASGTMSVITAAGSFVIVHNRAAWIPPGVEHQVKALDSLQLRTLFIDPTAVQKLPQHPSLISVSPLIRELILYAVSRPTCYDFGSADDRVMSVLLEQLDPAPAPSFHVPMPKDPRLLRVANALLENPADPRTLEEFAKSAGASTRTLTRLFQEETNMPFRQWRLQVRLTGALKRLAQNEPISNIALDLNYSTPSSFVVAFKKAFGVTPGRYFAS